MIWKHGPDAINWIYNGGEGETDDKQIVNTNKFQFDWFYCHKEIADFAKI